MHLSKKTYLSSSQIAKKNIGWCKINVCRYYIHIWCILKWVSNVCDAKKRTRLYLGLQVAADGRCERDMVHKINEDYRAWGALKSVVSIRRLVVKTKKYLALYKVEALGMRNDKRRKVNVLEKQCLRSLVVLSQWIKVGMKRCIRELE